MEHRSLEFGQCQPVSFVSHVGVTSVAYCHHVKLENLAFGLFRNSGKSDLMSSIRTISNSFWNYKTDT